MVWSSLDRYRDAGLLVARVGFGVGFAWFHGLPKLRGGPERWAGIGEAVGHFGIGFGHEWWGLAAALAESVGALMFAAGLFFRPAALALATVMLVATTTHLVTGEGSPAHALKNAWLFAGFVLAGPGRYSVDHLLARRRASGNGG